MKDIKKYTNEEKREAINQVIASRRDRYILVLRTIDGMGYKEIAYDPEVCLTIRQVARIISRGTDRIADYMRRRRIQRFFGIK